MVEAYDLDQAADSQLANISGRGFVETGSNVMIGGFILGGGGGNASVVVRALGPSLANAVPPVAGALADPTLELHDGNGALIRSNDNWKETQQTDIEATDLAPTNDLESAIFQTLARALTPRSCAAAATSPGWRWWKSTGCLRSGKIKAPVTRNSSDPIWDPRGNPCS